MKGEDADFAGLSDPVDAADALLDGGRAPREIVVHQDVAVLEVPPFPAQLRAEQHARTVGIAKACDQLVAFRRRQLSDVRERLDPFPFALWSGELRAQVVDRFARLREDQHFLVDQLAVEQLAELAQLRIVLGPDGGGAPGQCPQRLGG